MSELLILNAETNASISFSERLPSMISLTMESISSGDSFPPLIFFLMERTDSGRGEYLTSTTSPSDMPQRSCMYGVITIFPRRYS